MSQHQIRQAVNFKRLARGRSDLRVESFHAAKRIGFDSGCKDRLQSDRKAIPVERFKLGFIIPRQRENGERRRMHARGINHCINNIYANYEVSRLAEKNGIVK